MKERSERWLVGECGRRDRGGREEWTWIEGGGNGRDEELGKGPGRELGTVDRKRLGVRLRVEGLEKNSGSGSGPQTWKKLRVRPRFADLEKNQGSGPGPQSWNMLRVRIMAPVPAISSASRPHHYP